MELIILLLTAHFIGDFYLQPSNWVECRNINHIKSRGLWKHFFIHTFLNTLVVVIANLSILQAVISIVIISLSHLLTDYWKSHRENNLTYFLLDQIIHISIISIVWTYLSNFTLDQILQFFEHLITPKNLIIGISYILVCKPASVFISLALKKHAFDLGKTFETHSEHTVVAENESADENRVLGLESAGSWIGYIERCLAISFIFIGQFAGIGFLVATKTIFRFGDLTKNKDMKLTEYMMLGTLLSYTIAILIGWGALQIYNGLP